MGGRLFICILALCGSTSTAMAGQVYSPPPPRPVYIPPPPPPPRPQPVYQAPQPQPAVTNPNVCRNAGGQVVPCQASPPPVQVRQPMPSQAPGVQAQPTGQRPVAGPAASPNLNQASRVSLPNGAIAGTTPQTVPGQIPPSTPGRIQLVPTSPTPAAVPIKPSNPSPTTTTAKLPSLQSGTNKSVTVIVPSATPKVTTTTIPSSTSSAAPKPTSTSQITATTAKPLTTPAETAPRSAVQTAPKIGSAPVVGVKSAGVNPASTVPKTTPTAITSPITIATKPTTAAAGALQASAKNTAASPWQTATLDGAKYFSDKAQQIANSNPAKIAIDVGQTGLASAGGDLATFRGAGALGFAGSAANVAIAWKQQGALMGVEKAVEWGTTSAGGAAGGLLMPENPVVGRAIGQAVTQGAIDVGTTYVSPVLTNAMLWTDQHAFGGRVFGEGEHPY
jgi:hypothetical protein